MDHDWQMLVDLGQRLTVPPEIAITSQRPDLVLWSTALHRAYFAELSFPWEDAAQEAFERKKLRYSELVTEAEHRGWSAKVYPVEVGCQGFVATSMMRLTRDLA